MKGATEHQKDEDTREMGGWAAPVTTSPPSLPSEPLDTEEGREKIEFESGREEEGEGIESQRRWRSGFGVIREERALFGLV